MSCLQSEQFLSWFTSEIVHLDLTAVIICCEECSYNAPHFGIVSILPLLPVC
jgi:hypothetical protein